MLNFKGIYDIINDIKKKHNDKKIDTALLPIKEELLKREKEVLEQDKRHYEELRLKDKMIDDLKEELKSIRNKKGSVQRLYRS